jgi:hypothetical protein
MFPEDGAGREVTAQAKEARVDNGQEKTRAGLQNM